jgi:hypothetical protein
LSAEPRITPMVCPFGRVRIVVSAIVKHQSLLYFICFSDIVFFGFFRIDDIDNVLV